MLRHCVLPINMRAAIMVNAGAPAGEAPGDAQHCTALCTAPSPEAAFVSPEAVMPSGQKPSADVEQVLPPEQFTTLMLRNLPNNYTRAMLLSTLDREGFHGQYDFLYMPFDFTSCAGLGYAFVNLVDPGVVPHFWNKFDGYFNWDLPSRKRSYVSWCGPHQGFDAHVERYRNSPVMHEAVPDDYKPAVFAAGVRIPFPPPTKALRRPRVRNLAHYFNGPK